MESNKKRKSQNLVSKYESAAKKAHLDPNDLICPITKQIYCIPVKGSDGFTYEKFVLENIMLETKKSPMTREILTGYSDNDHVSTMVKNFLENNQKFKPMQFDILSYTSYYENKIKCHNLISDRKFNELCSYEEILLTDKYTDFSPIIVPIVKHCQSVDYFKQILEKSIDLNAYDQSNKTPMFYIFELGKSDFIFCALEKGGEVKNLNQNGINGLTLVLKNNVLDRGEKSMIIKYFIKHDFFGIDIFEGTMFGKILDVDKKLVECMVKKNIDNPRFLIEIFLNFDNMGRVCLYHIFSDLDYFVSVFERWIETIKHYNICDFLKKINHDLIEKLDFTKLYNSLYIVISDLKDNQFLNKDERLIIMERLDKLYFEHLEIDSLMDTLANERLSKLKYDIMNSRSNILK